MAQKNEYEIFMDDMQHYLGKKNFQELLTMLEKAAPEQVQLICEMSYKNPNSIILLSIIPLAIDRFVLKDTVLGIIKLLTGGLFGIWYLIDIFTAKSRAQKYNMKLVNIAFNKTDYSTSKLNDPKSQKVLEYMQSPDFKRNMNAMKKSFKDLNNNAYVRR